MEIRLTQHGYPLDKMAESQTTAVQQLKAEIAALIPKFDESFTHGDEYMYNILVNKLRQLSAV